MIASPAADLIALGQKHRHDAVPAKVTTSARTLCPRCIPPRPKPPSVSPRAQRVGDLREAVAELIVRVRAGLIVAALSR
jgi:antitoxin (DNA-binding transcriptional repressor) of toxin-antitoxin stability system